jgi:hypothetical protein
MEINFLTVIDKDVILNVLGLNSLMSVSAIPMIFKMYQLFLYSFIIYYIYTYDILYSSDEIFLRQTKNKWFINKNICIFILLFIVKIIVYIILLISIKSLDYYFLLEIFLKDTLFVLALQLVIILSYNMKQKENIIFPIIFLSSYLYLYLVFPISNINIYILLVISIGLYLLNHLSLKSNNIKLRS